MSDSGSNRSRSNSGGSGSFGSGSDSDGSLPPPKLQRVGPSHFTSGSIPQWQPQRSESGGDSEYDDDGEDDARSVHMVVPAVAEDNGDMDDYNASESDVEDLQSDPLLGAGRELTWQQLAAISRDPDARRRAHKRARAQMRPFLASHHLPQRLECLTVYSLGTINLAPGYCSPLALHPPGLRVSRYLYSPEQKRLVQCTLVVHDAASALAAGITRQPAEQQQDSDGDGESLLADSGPLFQVTVDCEPVDSADGISAEALASLRAHVEAERARCAAEEAEGLGDSSGGIRSALTAAEELLRVYEAEAAQPPASRAQHFVSDNLTDVWRQVRVAAGVLQPAEATDELRAEAERALEAQLPVREPADEEEEDLRRELGRAVRERADLRRCEAHNEAELARMQGREPSLQHRARHSALAAAAAADKLRRCLPPELHAAAAAAALNGASNGYLSGGSSSGLSYVQCLSVAAKEEAALAEMGLFSGEPFHSVSLDRLLEGLLGADACDSYVFLEHRPAGGRTVAGTPLEAAIAATAARPAGLLGAALAKSWEEQSVKAASDRRLRERAVKRKKGDSERARIKRAKDAELRSHKERVEERRMNKAKERAHVKSKRDHAKEKERHGRELRKKVESSMVRRRKDTRNVLAGAADIEEARALRGLPTNDSVCYEPPREGAPATTAAAAAKAAFARAAAAAAKAAATAGAADGFDSAGSTAAATESALTLLPPVHTAREAALSARVAPFAVLALSPELLGTVLQLWDFLHAFYPLLDLKRAPSLEHLASALAAADAAAAAGMGSTNSSSSSSDSSSAAAHRREGLKLLHKLGRKLAALFAPSLLTGLGLAMTAGDGEELDVAKKRAESLAAQLCGLLTWEEIARLALQAHAHREMGADEKEVPQRLLGRPPKAPIHFAGASALPAINAALAASAEADKRAQRLLQLRLADSAAAAAAAAAAVNGPTGNTAAGAGTVAAARATTAVPGSFKLTLPVPGPAYVARDHWAFPLLLLKDSDTFASGDTAAAATKSDEAADESMQVDESSEQPEADIEKARSAALDQLDEIKAAAAAALYKLESGSGLDEPAAAVAAQAALKQSLTLCEAALQAEQSAGQQAPDSSSTKLLVEHTAAARAAALAALSGLPAPAPQLQQQQQQQQQQQDAGLIARLQQQARLPPDEDCGYRGVTVQQFEAAQKAKRAYALRVSEEAAATKGRRGSADAAAGASAADGDNDDDDDDNSDDEEEEGDGEGSSSGGGTAAAKRAAQGKEGEDMSRFAPPQEAPEPLQRCYKVLLALLLQQHAGYFYHPLDPALHISYYEAVVRPLALRDVAASLKAAAEAAIEAGAAADSPSVQAAVTAFVEDIRLVFANAHCVAGGGGGSAYSSGYPNNNADLIAAADALSLAASGEKLSAVFERLVLDWLVDPAAPAVSALDDDLCCRCGIHHRAADGSSSAAAAAAAASTAAAVLNRAAGVGAAAGRKADHAAAAVVAAEGLLLMCDRCDRKYHLECLALPGIPTGDWFCRSCVRQRSLKDVDPIVGAVLTPVVNADSDAAAAAADETTVVTDVCWRHADRSTVYIVAGGVSPGSVGTAAAAAAAPTVALTWQQLTAAFIVPAAARKSRPFPIAACVPGYRQSPCLGPSAASGLAGISPALDPNISARAAALDSINPEFRALGQAQAALCSEGAAAAIGAAAAGPAAAAAAAAAGATAGTCRGARGWIRVLSALVQAAPLVCDSLQKAMTAGSVAVVEEVQKDLAEEPNKFSILRLPERAAPVSDSVAAAAAPAAATAARDSDAGSGNDSDDDDDEAEYNSNNGSDGDYSDEEVDDQDDAAESGSGWGGSAAAALNGSSSNRYTQRPQQQQQQQQQEGDTTESEAEFDDDGTAPARSAGKASPSPPSQQQQQQQQQPAAPATGPPKKPKAARKASPNPAGLEGFSPPPAKRAKTGSAGGKRAGSSGGGIGGPPSITPPHGAGAAAGLLDSSLRDDEELEEDNSASSGARRAALEWRRGRADRRRLREEALFAKKLRHELRRAMGRAIGAEMVAAQEDLDAGGNSSSCGSESEEEEDEGGATDADGTSEAEPSGAFAAAGSVAAGCPSADAAGASNGSKKRKKPRRPRCAFCGGDDMTLCSVLVQAPTWEESLAAHLGLPFNRGEAPEEVLLREACRAGNAAAESTASSSANDAAQQQQQQEQQQQQQQQQRQQPLSQAARALRQRLRAIGVVARGEDSAELPEVRAAAAAATAAHAAASLSTAPPVERLNPQRCLWLPVNARQREEEYRALRFALKREREEATAAAVAAEGSATVGAALFYGVESVRSMGAMAGSLVAHEVCAEAMVLLRAQRQGAAVLRLKKAILEEDALNRAGARTQPIGCDAQGRLYWQFNHAQRLLLVQPPSPTAGSNGLSSGSSGSSSSSSSSEWLCISSVQELAALLLRLDPAHSDELELQRALLRAYPHLRASLSEDSFLETLVAYTATAAAGAGSDSGTTSNTDAATAATVAEAGQQQPLYAAGNAVLVSSAAKPARQYAATVQRAPVWHSPSSTWLYTVSYKDWSSRFDATLPQSRLTAGSPAACAAAAQADAAATTAAAAAFEADAPAPVAGLLGSNALEAPERGSAIAGRPPPVFRKEPLLCSGLERARAALLTLEAALPAGAWSADLTAPASAAGAAGGAVKGAAAAPIIATSSSSSAAAAAWLAMVRGATCAATLMDACLLLEAGLHSTWVRGGGLPAVLLPPPSATLGSAATAAAVCLRAWVLDRSLLYSLNAAAVAAASTVAGGSRGRTKDKSPKMVSEAELAMGVGTRKLPYKKPSTKKKAVKD